MSTKQQHNSTSFATTPAAPTIPQFHHNITASPYNSPHLFPPSPHRLSHLSTAPPSFRSAAPSPLEPTATITSEHDRSSTHQLPHHQRFPWLLHTLELHRLQNHSNTPNKPKITATHRITQNRNQRTPFSPSFFSSFLASITAPPIPPVTTTPTTAQQPPPPLSKHLTASIPPRRPLQSTTTAVHYPDSTAAPHLNPISFVPPSQRHTQHSPVSDQPQQAAATAPPSNLHSSFESPPPTTSHQHPPPSLIFNSQTQLHTLLSDSISPPQSSFTTIPPLDFILISPSTNTTTSPPSITRPTHHHIRFSDPVTIISP